MQYIDQPTPAFAAEHMGHARAGAQDVFHAHPGCELDLMLAGACRLRLDGRGLVLNAGDLVLIAPGCPHRFIAEARPPERIVLHFDAAFLPAEAVPALNSMTAETGCCCLIAAEGQAPLYVRGLLERLLALSAAPAGDRTEARLLTAALLLFLREQQAAAAARGPSEAEEQTAAQIAAYLSTHHAEKLTMTAVAARFRRSPAHLSRVFRTATGQTMVQYLTGVRVQSAQRLLEDENAPGEEMIAQMCGFGSVRHFCRAFRAVTGLTPRQYRRAQKKQTDTT